MSVCPLMLWGFRDPLLLVTCGEAVVGRWREGDMVPRMIRLASIQAISLCSVLTALDAIWLTMSLPIRCLGVRVVS